MSGWLKIQKEFVRNDKIYSDIMKVWKMGGRNKIMKDEILSLWWKDFYLSYI